MTIPHVPTAARVDDDVSVVEDFDAFWADHTADTDRARRRRIRIFGAVVDVPSSLPLRLLYEKDQLAESEDIDDTRRLVGMVWGEDALDTWNDAGCTLEQFQLLLAYGFARGAGQQVTLTEVAARLDEARAAKDEQSAGQGGPGKAPNRAARRRGGGGSSRRSGR